MKKKILVVEPSEYFYKQLLKIACKNGDNLYVIGNKNIYGEIENFIQFDIRGNLNQLVEDLEKKQIFPDAIYTPSEMFIVHTTSLANYYNLNYNSKEDVEKSRKKSEMKKYWEEKNVLTPKSFFYTSLSDLKNKLEHINYPLIVKPVTGYASCGVKKVNSEQELFEQLNKIFLLNSTTLAQEHLNQKGFLLEEYIDGEEYSIDTLWFEGEAICNGIMSKGNAKGPYYPDRLYYTDPNISKNLSENLIESSHNAVRALGIKHGATHTEIRVKENKIYVIETTSRPGAGGGFYELFNQYYNIDFAEIYYNIHLFRVPDVIDIKKDHVVDKYFYWYNLPLSNRGIIKEIFGLESFKQNNNISEIVCLKKIGDKVYEENINSGYFCWILGSIPVKNNDIFKYSKKLESLVYYSV